MSSISTCFHGIGESEDRPVNDGDSNGFESGNAFMTAPKEPIAAEN